MEAVEYLKEKVRMCDSIRVCQDCQLGIENNGERLYCNDFKKKYPEKEVEIVEQWSKENPVKTYLTVLLERFPDVKLGNIVNDLPSFCPDILFGGKSWEGCRKSAIKCAECWNREYKEEKF